MADEPKEIKMKVGTKLTDAEIKTLDPKDVETLYAQPRKAEVEGQTGVRYLVCPYCGCGGMHPVRDHVDYPGVYIMCHCCGGVFRA